MHKSLNNQEKGPKMEPRSIQNQLKIDPKINPEIGRPKIEKNRALERPRVENVSSPLEPVGRSGTDGVPIEGLRDRGSRMYQDYLHADGLKPGELFIYIYIYIYIYII